MFCNFLSYNIQKLLCLGNVSLGLQCIAPAAYSSVLGVGKGYLCLWLLLNSQIFFYQPLKAGTHVA